MKKKRKKTNFELNAAKLNLSVVQKCGLHSFA